MRFFAAGLRAVLDLFYPEYCGVCGVEYGLKQWFVRGPLVPGLRGWDRPHLCRECYDRLTVLPVTRLLDDTQGNSFPVAAGCATGPDIVSLLAAMKYHGLRGIGWPLAGMTAKGLHEAVAFLGSGHSLVPVPLHSARQRVRGFNQAEVIARLAAQQLDRRCLIDVVSRTRRTRQQAKIAAGAAQRGSNVAGAFVARPAPSNGKRSVVIVDDLITSGGTVLAVAAALSDAGWDVCGGLSAGLSTDD